MQITRGRVLACSLALVVGAVVATADSPKAPVPVDVPSLPTVALPCPLPQVVPVVNDVPVLPELPKAEIKPLPPKAEPPKLDLPKVESPKLDLPITETTPAPDLIPATKIPATKPAAPIRTTEPLKGPAVKVVLLLGEGQPKFDVYSGDEAVLKVSCDKVDVRTPGDAGATMTPLKGLGHVQFILPGIVGSCDEVLVVAATGEIALNGNVNLISKNGKVETEFRGSNVRFKLSNVAGAISIGPGSISTDPLSR